MLTETADVEALAQEAFDGQVEAVETPLLRALDETERGVNITLREGACPRLIQPSDEGGDWRLVPAISQLLQRTGFIGLRACQLSGDQREAFDPHTHVGFYHDDIDFDMFSGSDPRANILLQEPENGIRDLPTALSTRTYVLQRILDMWPGFASGASEEAGTVSEIDRLVAMTRYFIHGENQGAPKVNTLRHIHDPRHKDRWYSFDWSQSEASALIFPRNHNVPPAAVSDMVHTTESYENNYFVNTEAASTRAIVRY